MMMAVSKPLLSKDPSRDSLDPGWEWPAILTAEERKLIEIERLCATNLSADPELMHLADDFASMKKWGGIHPRLRGTGADVVTRIYACADEGRRPVRSSSAGMAIALISFALAAYDSAKSKNGVR